MGARTWDGSLALPGLIVDHRAVVDGVVRMSGRMAASQATCPDCGTPSASCQSRYDRTLSDLPVSGAKVQLRLSARRFRCVHEPCSRRTFSEPLEPTSGRRYGRRIGRCEALLRAVAVALGGRPGARMMGRLAVPWSRDTMLATRRSDGRTAATRAGGQNRLRPAAHIWSNSGPVTPTGLGVIHRTRVFCSFFSCWPGVKNAPVRINLPRRLTPMRALQPASACFFKAWRNWS